MDTLQNFFLRVRHCDVTQLEMLNYIEQITSNFDLTKLKLLEIDFGVFYYPEKKDFIDNFSKEKINDAFKYHHENNIPIPKLNLPLPEGAGKEAIWVDYEQLLYPMEFYCCREFLGLIEHKIERHPENKQNKPKLPLNNAKGRINSNENTPPLLTFKDIFITPGWEKYIIALQKITPQLINEKWEFIGSPRKHKGVICRWLSDLKKNGKINQTITRQTLALVVNRQIKNINLGADGKSFDNGSYEYDHNFKQQLEEIVK